MTGTSFIGMRSSWLSVERASPSSPQLYDDWPTWI